MITWKNPAPDKRSHMDKYLSFFTGVKTYQLFHDEKKPGHPAMILHNPSPKELFKYNKRGYGIFLTVNETDGQGRTKKNIKKVRAVFADMDDAPVDINPIMDYNPHLVVQSSPGKYHVYWFVSDVPIEHFESLQESLIKTFGADPACKDVSRVLRVPGFFHCKKDPKPVYVLHTHNYPAISFSDIRNIFPPIKRKQYSSPRYAKPSPDSEFKGQYGESKGNRNHSCIKIIGGCLKRGLEWSAIEAEIWKHGKSCNPPMPDREIEHVLSSGRRYV